MVIEMKKNILIAVYNLEIGGIERSLINMLENIDYQRFEVDLLIYHHTGELMKYIPKQVNILPQLNSYSLFRKPIKQCLMEGHIVIPIVRVLSKLLAERISKSKRLAEGTGYIQMQLVLKYSSLFLPLIPKLYDLAISYAWPHDIVADKVRAKKKIAWVHTDYTKLEINNDIDLQVWRKFDHIASVSQECMNSFLITYPTLQEKVTVIENINSPKYIKEMATNDLYNSIKNNKEFILLSVGRLSYVKGYDLAIDALRLLHDKGYKNLKWYVVGYGGYESQLRKLISDNGLSGSFILLGKKINPYTYMNQCDLYVQPSRYEGKAVTVTEAKILGKPILITNYPTAQSQVSNGIDGLVCDINAESLANSIEYLYKNKNIMSEISKNVSSVDYGNTSELEKIYRIVD